jgi:hypothetical protein
VDRRRIAELAAKHRLPTVFPFAEHVAAGGLLAYALASLSSSQGRRTTWTESSRAPGPPICRSSSPRSSS